MVMKKKKENPINKKVIDWLWSHPEYREDIWNRIHNEFEDWIIKGDW